MTNYAPQGTPAGPAGPAAAAAAAGLGRVGAGAAARLGDRVSRRDAGVLQRLRAVGVGGRPAFPRPEGQLPPAGGRAGRLRPVRPAGDAGARPAQVVGSLIDDPLLVEMLFCPLLFYGGAREHDMDFGQFSILFRSIFLEGLARPLAGVRLILKTLVRQVQASWAASCGCAPACSRIVVKDGAGRGVVLDDGSELAARQRALLGRLAGDACACATRPTGRRAPAGRLSFVESISVARPPAARRWAATARSSSSTIREQVPLRAARRAGRRPQRRGLLAQQLRLRRAAGRRHGAHHGPGQLRPLGRPGRGGLPAAEAPLVRPHGRPRPSASCPISAAP